MSLYTRTKSSRFTLSATLTLCLLFGGAAFAQLHFTQNLWITPGSNGVVGLVYEATNEGDGGGPVTYAVYRSLSSFQLGQQLAKNLVATEFINSTTLPSVDLRTQDQDYYYTVIAFDTNHPFGSDEIPGGVQSNRLGVTADVTNPEPVTDLDVSPGLNASEDVEVELGFTTPDDSITENIIANAESRGFLFKYQVYRKAQINTLVQGDLIPANWVKTETGLNPYLTDIPQIVIDDTAIGGTEYAYALIIEDTVGNLSTVSSGGGSPTWGITPVDDLQLVGVPGVNNILTWTSLESSLRSGPAGSWQYKVYGKIGSASLTTGDLVPANLIDTLNNDETPHFFFHAHAGQTWAYAVLAVDELGRSSGISNALVVQFVPTPTPTSTSTPTFTSTPTETNTPTATFTDTPTFTATNTPTDTPTATDTPLETYTPTPTFTITNTPTDTPTITNTPTATNTPTLTNTPTDTPTPTYTDTPTPTFTDTPTPTFTDTPTPTPTPSPDLTPPGISALIIQPATATGGDLYGVEPASVLAIGFSSTEELDTSATTVTVGGNSATLVAPAPSSAPWDYEYTYQVQDTGTDPEGIAPVQIDAYDIPVWIYSANVTSITSTVLIDSSDPFPVTNLDAIPGAGGVVDLTWDAAVDDGGTPVAGIDYYNIYVDSTLATTTTNLFASLPLAASDGVPVEFRVTSTDYATNEDEVAEATPVVTTPDATQPYLVSVTTNYDPLPVPRGVFVTLTLIYSEPIGVTPTVSYTTSGTSPAMVNCDYVSGILGQTTFIYTGQFQTMAGQDGTATVSAAGAEDMVGNSEITPSPNAPFTFEIDVTDPNLTSLAVLPPIATGGDGDPATLVMIGFTSDEQVYPAFSTVTVGGNPAGFVNENDLGGGSYGYEYAYQVSLADIDGGNGVSVIMSDLAGNVGGITGSLYIDSLDPDWPTITSVIPSAGGQLTVNLLEPSDYIRPPAVTPSGVAIYTLFEDMAPVMVVNAPTTSFTYMSPFDGTPHSYRLTATDFATNECDIASATPVEATPDASPPVIIAVTAVVDPLGLTNGPQQIRVEFSEYIPTGSAPDIEYETFNGTVVSCTPVLPEMGSGNRIFRAMAVASALAGQDGSATVRVTGGADPVGNVHAPFSAQLFTIDVTPPALDTAFDLVEGLGAIPPAISSVLGNSSILGASVSDNLTGVVAVTIDLSEPVFLTGGSPLAVMSNIPATSRYIREVTSTSPNAVYDLIVSATDGANNSATDSIQIIVDNEAPVWVPDFGIGDATNGTTSFLVDGQINRVANIAGIGLDNRPSPGTPSGIRRMRVFYRSFDGDGSQPILTYDSSGNGYVDGDLVEDFLAAPTRWTFVNEQVVPYGDGFGGVDFDIEWDVTGLTATNVRTFENYYLIDLVFDDVAGNMLGPVFGGPATGALGQYSLLQIMDNIAPEGITWLQAHSQNGSRDVLLDWSINGPAADNGDLLRYDIYRSENSFSSVIQPNVFLLASIPARKLDGSDNLSYLDTTAPSDTDVYYYGIVAVDSEGNGSFDRVYLDIDGNPVPAGYSPNDPDDPNLSNVVAAAINDIAVPSSITDLQAVPGASINLFWSHATDNVGIIGYEIYRKAQSIPLSDADANNPFPVSATDVNNLVPTNLIDTIAANLQPRFIENEMATLDANDPTRIVLRGTVSSVQRVFNETTGQSYSVDSVSGRTVVLASDPSPEFVFPTPTDKVLVDYRTSSGIYSDRNVLVGKTYAYAVVALDAAGNRAEVSSGAQSGNTDAEEDTVAQAYDTTAPEGVQNLVASRISASTTTINLSWLTTPKDDVGVIGYNIYRSMEPILSVQGMTPIYGTKRICLAPSDSTQTLELAKADSYLARNVFALDRTRGVEIPFYTLTQSFKPNYEFSGVSEATVYNIPKTRYAGAIGAATLVDNICFAYRTTEESLFNGITYFPMTQFMDDFSDPSAPSVLEKQTFYYAITAVDLAGNESLMSNQDSIEVPDITPPAIDRSAVQIVSRAPGSQDYVYGEAGAISEGGLSVQVYIRFGIQGGPVGSWILVGTVTSGADGTFPLVFLGDNLSEDVRIVAIDEEGRTAAENFIRANDIYPPSAPGNLSIVARAPFGLPGPLSAERGNDMLQGSLYFDPAIENLDGLTIKVYSDSGLVNLVDDFVVSSYYAGVSVPTEFPFSGAQALDLGDNAVGRAYVLTVDAAGNKSAVVSIDNDITSPPNPFFVMLTPGVIVDSGNPNLVLDTSEDLISGAVFGDVSRVRVFANPNGTGLMGSDTSFISSMFEVSVGDRVNLAADEVYFVVALDSSGNPSEVISVKNDTTAPPINRDFIVQNPPGTDDLISVQTEPNAYVTVFSTSVTSDPSVEFSGLVSPQGIAFTPSGALYVADSRGSAGAQDDALVMYGSNKHPVVLNSTLPTVTGISYNALLGDLIVSTSLNSITAAAFVSVDPTTGIASPYLQLDMIGRLSSLAIDYSQSKGYFVVDTKHDLYQFNIDPLTGAAVPGTIASVPGSKNRYRSPKAVALNPSGDLLVVDQRNLGQGQDVLTKLTAAGLFTVLTSGLSQPTGLAVDTQGNAFVSSHINTGDALQPVVSALLRINGMGEITSVVGYGLNPVAIGGAFTNRGDGYIIIGSQASGNLVKLYVGAEGLLLPAPVPPNGIPAGAQILAQGFADGAGQFAAFSIGDNLVPEVGVVAIDEAGNYNDPPVMAVNDIYPPAPPVARLFPYPPGQMDRIEAFTEPRVYVKVFSDSSLINLIAEARANDEGYVAGIDVGDNAYIEFYVAVSDLAGNQSSAVRLLNDVTPPAPPAATIVMNVPGVQDRVDGIAAADVTLIRVYRDVNITNLIAEQVPSRGVYSPVDQSFSIAVGDNVYARLYVTALDAAGNQSGVTSLFNDIIAPLAVDPNRMIVESNPPGQSDMVYGGPYAAEPLITVNVYRDASLDLTALIESAITGANGSVPEVDLGDNANGYGWAEIYLQLVDDAGNKSPVVSVLNDIEPPAIPDVNRIFVVTNAPGAKDEVFGIEGAIEPFADIKIWVDPVGDPTDLIGIWLANEGSADAAGAFQTILIDENRFNGGKFDPLFIQAIDAAGNVSALLQVGNEYFAYAMMDAYGNIFTGNMEVPEADTYTKTAYLMNGLAQDLEPLPGANGSLEVLDGFGFVTPIGAAADVGGVTGFGFNIARDIEFCMNETSLAPNETSFELAGYLMDGWGAVHVMPGGGTPHGFAGAPYFGWDIAKDFELELGPNGEALGFYLLDGLGAVHEAGFAQEYSGKPYFNFDIARDLHVIRQKSTNATLGYIILDGYGGLHALNTSRPMTSPYFGWDIARKIDAPPSGRGVYVVDGMGGVHAVGGAKPIMDAPYFGWDVLRDFEIIDVFK